MKNNEWRLIIIASAILMILLVLLVLLVQLLTYGYTHFYHHP